MGKKIKKKTAKISVSALLKIVRKHCVRCSGGLISEVKSCPMKHCDLYRYRLGKINGKKKKGE